MKKTRSSTLAAFVLGAALCLLAGSAFAQISPGGGSATPSGNLPYTPAAVFNIVDPINGQSGAKCDGVTNDNAAINRTFAAALASTAYQNNNAIAIVGPTGASYQGCVINGINATGFTKGTGANTRPQVEVSNMTLLCTGSYNICFDALGSDLIKMHDVSIRGDTQPNTPEICIQVGVINGTSAAWHQFQRVNCNNEFAMTALLNFGSEANQYIDDMFVNSHTTSGPIGTVGTLVAGTGYTPGTFTNVTASGGPVADALFTIVVNGSGNITSVTNTFAGHDYTPGNVLTFAGGTGGSVTVATVTPYAVILDGQNYWHVFSYFVTNTLPVNTWVSLTLNSFEDTNIRNLGIGDPMWVAWTGGLHMYHSYMLNSSGANCLDVFDNGVTKSGIPGPNWGMDIDTNCEGGSSLLAAFRFTGSNATPAVQDFRYRGYYQAANMFVADSAITAVGINNADIDVKFAQYNSLIAPVFASAKIYTVSGKVAVPSAPYWNAPKAFQGSIVYGASATPPNMGPVDIFAGSAGAYSCARLLLSTYTGALCALQRASDSTASDFYPDGFGNLDRAAVTVWCANTTCTLKTMYDQSGTSNCTQTTTASQPTFTLALAALGSRPAATFGDAGALALTCPSVAGNTDIFAAGGYATAVDTQAVTSTTTDRILYKTNGGAIGWQWYVNTTGSSRTYFEGGATTNGQWTTTAPGNISIVEDVSYSYASVANVPVLSMQGTQVNSTAQQPVGAQSSDTGQALLIGNNAVTAGTHGFPGSIAEIVLWKALPTAAQQEAIRRNEGAYYGITAIN